MTTGAKDCEGSDGDVLKGAENLLRNRSVKYVIFEQTSRRDEPVLVSWLSGGGAKLYPNARLLLFVLVFPYQSHSRLESLYICICVSRCMQRSTNISEN